MTGSGRSRKGRGKAGEKQWFQARSGREQAVEGPGAVPHRCVAAGEDELAGHTASDGAVWVLEEASGAADLSEPGHCRDSQTVSRRCPDGVHKVSGTQDRRLAFWFWGPGKTCGRPAFAGRQGFVGGVGAGDVRQAVVSGGSWRQNGPAYFRAISL